MPVKTFRAKTLNQALNAVKSEFGPEAVILHTKIHKVGGVLGFGAQTVHEITATAPAPSAATTNAKRQSPARSVTRTSPDEDHDERRRRLLELAKQHAAANRRQAIAPPAGVPEQREQSNTSYGRPLPKSSTRTPGNTTQDIARASVLQDETGVRRNTQDAAPAAPRMSQQPRQVPAQDPAANISARIDDLSRMVERMVGTAHSEETKSLPAPFARAFVNLVDNDVPRTIAQAIVEEARRSADSTDEPDVRVINAALIAAIARRLPCQAGIPKPQKQADNRPLTIAFTGPTGVGKTTTIAKLAATFKLRFGARVALLTCDTFRIAAVDQLRTYANIIGVPVQVAVTPRELKAAAADLEQQADIILVDTAGRSHSDAGKIDELAAGLRDLQPHQTHLVLSASAAPQVLSRAARQFSHACPTHVTLTKLDEAVTAGAVFAMLKELRANGLDPRIAYTTNGQQVPEQIDLAVPERIAAMLLGSESEESAQCGAGPARTAQDQPPIPLKISESHREDVHAIDALHGTA